MPLTLMPGCSAKLPKASAMSEAVEIVLVGATGMIGRQVMERAVGRRDVHLAAMARREVALPKGARMEMLVADPDYWPDAIAVACPDVLVIALGTTIKAENGDQARFRAVDRDLVVELARAAKDGGVQHVIVVSSVGAAMGASNFYLSVKGEMEDALAKLRFHRLDIIRPGLLVGRREGAARPLERLGMLLNPLLNALLHGGFRKYRAIKAAQVADAILELAKAKVKGRYVHEYDEMQRIVRKGSRFPVGE